MLHIRVQWKWVTLGFHFKPQELKMLVHFPMWNTASNLPFNFLKLSRYSKFSTSSTEHRWISLLAHVVICPIEMPRSSLLPVCPPWRKACGEAKAIHFRACVLLGWYVECFLLFTKAWFDSLAPHKLGLTAHPIVPALGRWKQGD